MLDEPAEGLASVIVEEIVAQPRLILETGVEILLVDENLEQSARTSQIVTTSSNSA